MRGASKKAATYSPTWCGSTIGANGLNFPVRNGKGWAPSPWPPRTCPGPVPGSLGDVPGIAGKLQEQFHQIDMTYYGTDACIRKEESTRYVMIIRSLRKGNAQAYGQLVPLGCMHRCTSTYGLSTWSSPTAL